MRSSHIQKDAWRISTSMKHHYGASYQFSKITLVQFLFDNNLSMEIMCPYDGHLQNWVGQTVNWSWRCELFVLLLWSTQIAMEVMVGLSKCLKKNLFDTSIRICMVQSMQYTRWVSLCMSCGLTSLVLTYAVSVSHNLTIFRNCDRKKSVQIISGTVKRQLIMVNTNVVLECVNFILHYSNLNICWRMESSCLYFKKVVFRENLFYKIMDFP